MSAEIANLGRRIFIATHYDNVVNCRAPTAIILTLAAQAMLAYHSDNIFSGACVSIAAGYASRAFAIYFAVFLFSCRGFNAENFSEGKPGSNDESVDCG